MNIDAFMLIRKENGLSNPDQVIDQITKGIDQMGKPYDFNFDVQTLDKIVCSELLYIIFGNVHWPTQYQMGRSTITPDNIAEIIFQKGTPFRMKTFINSLSPSNIFSESLDKVAGYLGYEKKPGSEGFYKVSNKCYIVKDALNLNRRKCETVYTQVTYEER
jgi:hypothetical protein